MLHRSLDASQVIVRLHPSCLFIAVKPLHIKDHDEGDECYGPTLASEDYVSKLEFMLLNNRPLTAGR